MICYKRLICIFSVSCILTICSQLYASSNFLKGRELYKSKDYRASMDMFMQALITDPHNLHAKKYLKKSADKFLKSRQKSIEKEIKGIVKSALPDLKDAKKQKRKLHKKMGRLFKTAKKDYNKKRFLKASDNLRKILLEYPGYERAKQHYKKINSEMSETSKMIHTADLESLAYAKGYVYYRKQKYYITLSEWEKLLELNPKRSEIAEYASKVKAYLKDEEQLAREKQIEERAENFYKNGVEKFDNKKWVPCIKTMEHVQYICKNEPFPKSLEWHDRAHEYIEKAVKILSKIVASKPEEKPAIEGEKPHEAEIDIAGSEKKYDEGLIYYAHGKIFDAVKAWEIALRLNPDNEKALKALKNVNKELEMRGKE